MVIAEGKWWAVYDVISPSWKKYTNRPSFALHLYAHIAHAYPSFFTSIPFPEYIFYSKSNSTPTSEADHTSEKSIHPKPHQKNPKRRDLFSLVSTSIFYTKNWKFPCRTTALVNPLNEIPFWSSQSQGQRLSPTNTECNYETTNENSYLDEMASLLTFSAE